MAKKRVPAMLCWRLKEVNELLAVLERVKARIQEHL